nr:MAG TPA_asm: hypothetical protein [Caudoviricetes sp.]
MRIPLHCSQIKSLCFIRWRIKPFFNICIARHVK